MGVLIIQVEVYGSTHRQPWDRWNLKLDQHWGGRFHFSLSLFFFWLNPKLNDGEDDLSSNLQPLGMWKYKVCYRVILHGFFFCVKYVQYVYYQVILHIFLFKIVNSWAVGKTTPSNECHIFTDSFIPCIPLA